MKKIILTIGLLFFASTCFASELNITRRGESSITVTGYADRKLYLGVTATINGREYDFDYPEKKIKGRINESYNASVAYNSSKIGGSWDNNDDPTIEWTASLWEEKVTKNCRCSYCQKNGYHFEGRVATANN